MSEALPALLIVLITILGKTPQPRVDSAYDHKLHLLTAHKSRLLASLWLQGVVPTCWWQVPHFFRTMCPILLASCVVRLPHTECLWWQTIVRQQDSPPKRHFYRRSNPRSALLCCLDYPTTPVVPESPLPSLTVYTSPPAWGRFFRC
jgi:hypothetical protein